MFHAASYQKFSGVAPFLLYPPGEGMSVVVTQTSLSWSRTSWGPRTVVHKRVYRPLVGVSNWYFNTISRRFRSRLRSDITHTYIYIYVYFFWLSVCKYIHQEQSPSTTPIITAPLLRLLLVYRCMGSSMSQQNVSKPGCRAAFGCKSNSEPTYLNPKPQTLKPCRTLKFFHPDVCYAASLFQI